MIFWCLFADRDVTASSRWRRGVFSLSLRSAETLFKFYSEKTLFYWLLLNFMNSQIETEQLRHSEEKSSWLALVRNLISSYQKDNCSQRWLMIHLICFYFNLRKCKLQLTLVMKELEMGVSRTCRKRINPGFSVCWSVKKLLFANKFDTETLRDNQRGCLLEFISPKVSK